ncbi:LURP1-related protein domain containing protein [Heracleum sosnowskyi]|uniref:LURP1-related protein domain containing protein n=1 Tax=Heracleum sosnowskyi TaxID=360622 RepID=A0AAD8GUT4_9APIA|nr:LURP1-related protein domain containing protein [Heracleum sosnowskyi]
MPIIGKNFCSSSQVVLKVRKRPHVVNGGGFVVTDCTHRVIFRVDGCGVLGRKDELLLRDGNGNALLLIRKKGGLVEAISIYRQWRGYTVEFKGSDRPLFRVKQPNLHIVNQNLIKISTDANEYQNKRRDFEIKGYFPDRECSIVDSKGSVIAEVALEEITAINDLYRVVVNPGIDQAFVIGVIAVLDYIYDGSTRC